MCNSSFQLTNTTSPFEESLNWYCICKGYFGPTLIMFTSVLCFVFGMPFHCCSLWVSLHGNIKANLVFPLNITILELLFCIQCIIDFTVITLLIFNKHSMISYSLANFLIGLSWTFRPLIQIMCLEHYFAVIYPLTLLRYKGIKYRIALAATAWLIAGGNSFRLVYTGMDYFRDHIFFLCFCMAETISSFCCASVLCALKRPGPGDQKNAEMTEQDRHKKTDRGRSVENKQKRKAFRIIAHILVSILVCYMPLVVSYFMNVPKDHKLIYFSEGIPLVLATTMISVFISPLVRVYTERHQKHVMCFSNIRK